MLLCSIDGPRPLLAAILGARPMIKALSTGKASGRLSSIPRTALHWWRIKPTIISRGSARHAVAHLDGRCRHLVFSMRLSHDALFRICHRPGSMAAPAPRLRRLSASIAPDDVVRTEAIVTAARGVGKEFLPVSRANDISGYHMSAS